MHIYKVQVSLLLFIFITTFLFILLLVQQHLFPLALFLLKLDLCKCIHNLLVNFGAEGVGGDV